MWIRVRQLSRQLTMRMQERVNERTRIARELHDTLLQGLASASLQLEVADRQISADATSETARTAGFATVAAANR